MEPSQISKILLNTFSFLETADVELLLELGKYQKFKNREEIISRGQLARIVFFSLKGMVRGYYINNKGEEKNIFLRPSRTITGAPDSLFNNVHTKYTFEAILETHLLVFPYGALQKLSATHPNLGKLYAEGLHENILTLISRVESLIDKTPEERYEALLERSPQFFQTAFNKHIANYLGITPVSLSRIIKRKKENG